IPAAEAETITSARELADYFEQTARETSPALAAHWVTGEVLRWMKDRKTSPEEALSFPVAPARLAGLLRPPHGGQISAASAKEVFAATLDSTGSAEEIVAAKGLGQISDAGELQSIADQIVAANPSQVAVYRSGKTQTFGWFVGEIMKKTGRRADPAKV